MQVRQGRSPHPQTLPTRIHTHTHKPALSCRKPGGGTSTAPYYDISEWMRIPGRTTGRWCEVQCEFFLHLGFKNSPRILLLRRRSLMSCTIFSVNSEGRLRGRKKKIIEINADPPSLWLTVCCCPSHHISGSLLLLPLPLLSPSAILSPSVSSSPFRCTEAIVKHWPESRALRRLRGSRLTDRWISPQAPRTGIVRKAFLSHRDPCGLRIPGFCCNNQASHTHTHTAKRNTAKHRTASSADDVHHRICPISILKRSYSFIFFPIWIIHDSGV